MRAPELPALSRGPTGLLYCIIVAEQTREVVDPYYLVSKASERSVCRWIDILLAYRLITIKKRGWVVQAKSTELGRQFMAPFLPQHNELAAK